MVKMRKRKKFYKEQKKNMGVSETNITPNKHKKKERKKEETPKFEHNPKINLEFELILSECPLGQLLLPLIQQEVLISLHWLEHVEHVEIERQASDLLGTNGNPTELVAGNGA